MSEKKHGAAEWLRGIIGRYEDEAVCLNGSCSTMAKMFGIVCKEETCRSCMVKMMTAIADRIDAAIAKRERDEKEAREISEAMRRRAGLKPDNPRKTRKRPLASPRLLTCPVCGKRFETSETHRVTCSDECAKKRRAEKAKARYAAKVVRTVRECAVCGRSFEVPGKSRKLTCSEACAKVRKRERELAWKAATRGAADAHAQMDSPRTAAPSLVSVVK